MNKELYAKIENKDYFSGAIYLKIIKHNVVWNASMDPPSILKVSGEIIFNTILDPSNKEKYKAGTIFNSKNYYDGPNKRRGEFLVNDFSILTEEQFNDIYDLYKISVVL